MEAAFVNGKNLPPLAYEPSSTIQIKNILYFYARKRSLCGPLPILGPTYWGRHPRIKGGPGRQSIVSWICSVEAINEVHLLGFF